MTQDAGTGTPLVVIAYDPQGGGAAALAAAARDGAGEEGVRAVLADVAAMGEDGWALLDEADGIVFGAPAHANGASAAFRGFAEESSGRWAARVWADKAASGFATPGHPSGGELGALRYFSVLASQHGMHWVDLDLPPACLSPSGAGAGSAFGPGSLSGFGPGSGPGAAGAAACGAALTEARETVRHLGRRVAQVARLLRARDTGAAPPGVLAG
ncbi:NADPH-dependent FMN reductase [Streptomyces subrutilus]|uniref:flavodoxin family protein n=1 Tax=Streptomyces subrutilus TaxID=36818 RepID=UPI00340A20D9